MADSLRAALLRWYDAGRRDLPWRRTTDTYAVWVSETMLQQTTVAAVVPHFERWMARFPSVEALAAASEEDVLTLWQGLGYYRRARNLRLAAQRVVSEGWPQDERGWLALPGVGKYTAGAVRSICLCHRVPAVDGNVERVYARLQGDTSTSLNGAANDWAARLVACDLPGDVNQALMDFGATVCRPKNPICGDCTVRRWCAAFKDGTQAELPRKLPKRRSVELRREYVVQVSRGKIGVRRFGKGEWWAGMYGFAERNGEWNGRLLCSFRHTVTNHKIDVKATLVKANRQTEQLEWRTLDELMSLPMPTPHRKIRDCVLQAIGAKSTGTARLPSSDKK